MHHGNVGPLRASVFGGWTDGHQAAVASDSRACQHAHLSEQKSVNWLVNLYYDCFLILFLLLFWEKTRVVFIFSYVYEHLLRAACSVA